MLNLETKDQKKKSFGQKKKSLKIKIKLLAISTPVIFLMGVIMAFTSSTSQIYSTFSTSVNGKLSDEDNAQLIDYLKDKVEEINNENTYTADNKKIGKLSDYYNTDEMFKLRWNYALAYYKYRLMADDDTDDIDALKARIDTVLQEIKPKFIYKMDKVTTVTKETYVDKDNTTKTKTTTSQETIYLLIHAENIEKTCDITYKQSTVTQGNSTITRPEVDSLNYSSNKYENLKKAILNIDPNLDADSDIQDIRLMAETYVNENLLGLTDINLDDISDVGDYTGTGESFTGSQKDFMDKIGTAAIKDYPKSHIWPSVTVAQAIIESGWGKSGLTKRANNLFGIKAYNWSGPTVSMITSEYNGVQIVAQFRAYGSWDESIEDHNNFLLNNSTYAQHGLFNAKNYQEAALALQNAGYATVQNENGEYIYAQLLCNYIKMYKLDQYDTQALAQR